MKWFPTGYGTDLYAVVGRGQSATYFYVKGLDLDRWVVYRRQGPQGVQKRVGEETSRDRAMRMAEHMAQPRQGSYGKVSRAEIVDMMARTLFVTAWADREEERGRTYPGQDLMDVAPSTPHRAREAARALASRIEVMNGANLPVLYDRAIRTPGKHYREPTPRDFGYGLAMQSLGHGVSWFDDHPRFPLKLPHIEFYL